MVSKARPGSAMMLTGKALIDRTWTVHGFPAVILENEHLRVVVLPDLGAKIYQLIDRRSGHDLLYHHPRVLPRTPVFGVNVDDWWCGGMDEVLPTGHPCTLGDDELPFLGEVWSMPWSVEPLGDACVAFQCDCVISPLRVRRVLELRPGERFVRMRHEVTATGYRPQPLIWGLHPSFPLTGTTRVDIPTGQAVWSEGGPGPLGRESGECHPWSEARVHQVRDEPDGTWDLSFAVDLTDGWFAVRDEAVGLGVGMTFPADLFKCVWVWRVDGGWRGIRCVAVEPWTGWPGRLDQALEQGHAEILEPGEKLLAETRLIVFDADGPVTGFDAAGHPLRGS